MAAIQHERERKFDIADDVEVPDLPGVSVRGESTVTLTAEYWDTRDRRLLRWGHTLRHRRASDGSEDGWTLKLDTPSNGSGPDLDRVEVHVTGSAQSPPPHVRSLVAGIVRREPLRRIATITTIRRRVGLSRSEDGEVEISDDFVSSTVEGQSAPTFRQLEVEATGPRSDPLLDAMSVMLTEAGATPTDSSKLERVLDGSSDPEIVVPRGGADTTIEELSRIAIGAGTMRLLRHDPAVRLGSDPEAVHQARVATRRLRSDLKALEPPLAPTRVAWLRSELAWIGGLLGAVRDLDVLMRRVGERSDPKPEVRELVPTIVGVLEEDRRARHLELVDALGSARYVHLVDTLIGASNSPPLADGVIAERRARGPLRKAARKAWRRLPRAVKRLDADPSDAALHEIRKRAKRARYVAELATGVFGKKADRMVHRLEDLQDVLGELQDAVMAEDRLTSVGLHRLSDGAAFGAGVLSCGERGSRLDARHRWRSAWGSARAKRLRRWLR